MGCTGSKASLAESADRVSKLEEELASSKAELAAALATKTAAKPVLVLGSTGFVGKATLKALSGPVLAGMRDTSKAKECGVDELENVAAIKVDMGNSDEVAKVIVENKVGAVFVIVPGHEARTAISLAAIEGCRMANVGGMVVVSVATASNVGTCFGDQFQPIEKATKESGVPHCLVRLPLFSDNAFLHMESIKTQNSIYAPLKPDTQLSTVTTGDIGAAVAVLLADVPAHNGKTYTLVSDTTSQAELAAAFSDSLGVPVQYVQVPYPDARAAMLGMDIPAWKADGILELYTLGDNADPAMTQPTTDLETVLGRKPTSTKSFVASIAPMFKAESGAAAAAAAAAAAPADAAAAAAATDKPVVLVLASTGYVGKAVVPALAKAGATVLAAMRDTSKAKDAGFEGVEGVTSIKLQVGDSDGIAKAIKEHKVTALYVVAPGAQNRKDLCIAALEGAKQAGDALKAVVVLSVASVPCTGTTFADNFAQVEKAALASGLPIAVVRLPLFTENVFASQGSIKSGMSIYSPADPEAVFGTVTTADAGEAVAKMLTAASFDAHAGKTYTLVSDVQTSTKQAAWFSEALGAEVKYVRVPYEDAKKAFMGMGFPEWQTDGVLELYKLIDEKKEPMSVVGDLEGILGRKPTSTKDFITQVAGAFKADAVADA